MNTFDKSSRLMLAINRIDIWGRTVAMRLGRILSNDDLRHAGAEIARNPVAIEDACWRGMLANQKVWSDCVELPTACVVRVSPEDWHGYWRVDTPDKCRMLSDRLAARAKDKLGSHEVAVKVTILPSGSVSQGYFDVATSFAHREPRTRNEPGAPNTTLQSTQRVARDNYGASTGQSTAKHMGDYPVSEGVPQTKKSPLSRTSCILALPDGSIQSVWDGGTIGSNHGSCTLRFDTSQYPHLHRLHAEFKNVSGHWKLVNVGKNGSQVFKADGSVRKLDAGNQCILDDGDVLVLGQELTLVFYNQSNMSWR